MNCVWFWLCLICCFVCLLVVWRLSMVMLDVGLAFDVLCCLCLLACCLFCYYVEVFGLTIDCILFI